MKRLIRNKDFILLIILVSMGFNLISLILYQSTTLNTFQIQKDHKFNNNVGSPSQAQDISNSSTFSHEIPHYADADYSKLESIGIQTIIAHDSPFTQTITVLIICVDFQNKAHDLTIQEVQQRFETAQRNMRDYWEEVSLGHLILNFDFIDDWVTLQEDIETYAYDTNDFIDAGLYNCIGEVYDAIDDDVDFSNYMFTDIEGDTRSFIGVIFPGWCQSYGGIYSGEGEDREFWSQKGTIYEYYDYVQLNNYFIASEYPDSLGTATHEFGHMLGLPDLYDVLYQSYGIGEWGLMSYGSHLGGFGNCPCYLSAWCKVQFGWTDLQVVKVGLEDNQVVIDTLTPTSTAFPVIYKILKYLGGTEYFLLEARFQHPNSYDHYIPDEGLLILHVDDSKDYQSLYLDNLMVDIEENEAIQNLEEPLFIDENINPNSNRGDIDDCWDLDDIFDPNSNPNSNWYGEVNSQISIEIISISLPNYEITIEITAPEPPPPPIVGIGEMFLFTTIITLFSIIILIKKQYKNSFKIKTIHREK